LLSLEAPGFARAALDLQPLSPSACAAVALGELKTATDDAARAHAEFLSRRSLGLGSDQVGVWMARLAFLEQAGKIEDALLVGARATQRFPTIPDAWSAMRRLLAARPQPDEALGALTRAVELASDPEIPFHVRGSLLKARAELLRERGLQAEAERDLHAARFPDRSPDAPAELLDLTQFYGAGLADEWHNPQEPGSHLALLPTGLQEFGGVRWDVRGVI
jgi:tetratricopeptide (TPR) repeat protein